MVAENATQCNELYKKQYSRKMKNEQHQSQNIKCEVQVTEEIPWKRVVIPLCCVAVLALIVICICYYFCCCKAIGALHAIEVVSAVVLMFAAALFSSRATSVALIFSILLILVGLIMYNPLTNTIPIKWLGICNYCKVAFYENFQTAMSGVCRIMC